jgi:hypothetical protein
MCSQFPDEEWMDSQLRLDLDEQQTNAWGEE